MEINSRFHSQIFWNKAELKYPFIKDLTDLPELNTTGQRVHSSPNTPPPQLPPPKKECKGNNSSFL